MKTEINYFEKGFHCKNWKAKLRIWLTKFQSYLQYISKSLRQTTLKLMLLSAAFQLKLCIILRSKLVYFSGIDKHRRTGRHFAGGRKKIAFKITICPKNKKLALKPTFLVQSEVGLKLVNLFYIVEFVYNRFVCNVNSLITLHFVRSRWHLLHAFQFVHNFNSAITFLI